MRRKIVSMLILTTIALSVIGCGEQEKNLSTETESVVVMESRDDLSSESKTVFDDSVKTEDVVTTDEEIEEPVKKVEEPVEKESVENTVNEEPTVKKPNIEYSVKDIDKTLYTTASLNVRSGPDAEYDKLAAYQYAEEVKVTGKTDNGWYRVNYNDSVGYVSGKYLTETKPEVKETVSSSKAEVSKSFPITYSDSTCNITITKEWYKNAWCYAAHIVFSDYDRLGTSCGNGKYGGTETTSHAAKRLGAMLCVNGCYSAPNLHYAVARDGVVYNDKACWTPAVYNSNNGLLLSAWETGGTPGIAGVQLSTLVSEGKVTDTFCFGPPILVNGNVSSSSDSSRAQRTFIGTNGNAGDIWIVVSDGRYNDGESAGLTYKECSSYLASKGCTFGVPLDGGGSSTFVWNGKVLNAVFSQRSVVDFLYFK